MSRCTPHRIVEPCFYCAFGVQKFNTTAEHLDALENRLRNLERRSRGEVAERGAESVDGIDLKEAVAVIRDYALGDLVMLSPSLKALKEKDPKRPLVLVTRPELMGVLAGNEFLDAQLPKSSYEHANFYRAYDLCGAVETEAGGKLGVKEYLTKPRPDIFADRLGVPGGAEEFPLVVNQDALSKMRAILTGCKKPIIGVAPTCNSTIRVMPPEYVEPLVKKLLQHYQGTVVLLGKTNKWNQELADLKMPGAINLVDGLSVPELIAMVSLMDAMISPDTGTMHVAGALGVKCLALMGNNNPKNFSDFYAAVQVLQPTAKELPCVPCNDRSIPCAPLPEDQYGAECMRLMTPERVQETFQKFYNGVNIAYLHDTSLSYVGGAEITTKGMIKAGRGMGYNVRLFDKEAPVEQLYNLYGYDLIIFSNIWRFSKEAMAVIMEVIRNVPYVKYEHDHDGLGPAPQGYPKASFAAKIYRNSALNIFVSPAHQADYCDHFADMGKMVCIPELIDTEMFSPVKGVKRQAGQHLIAVPGKWDRQELAEFTEKHASNVFALNERIAHKQMPALYSQYEFFAHYPAKKWPCDRVIFEAALCGCKIEAGEIVEAMSWEKDLTDQKALRAWLKQVPGKFWDEIEVVLEEGKP